MVLILQNKRRIQQKRYLGSLSHKATFTKQTEGNKILKDKDKEIKRREETDPTWGYVRDCKYPKGKERVLTGHLNPGL